MATYWIKELKIDGWRLDQAYQVPTDAWTAGRGYIALAALIFAKWRPWYALFACLLFGLLQAVALRFQNIDLGGITIPVQVMDALPYILTVIILAGFVGKAIPPRASGEPYQKER